MESATEVQESINTSAPSESITNVQKWVKYINKSIDEIPWGDWSEWSRTQYDPSDSRQVESRTVTDQAAYTSYVYYIWRTNNGNGWGTQGYSTNQGVFSIYDQIEITTWLNDTASGCCGYYQSPNFSSNNANQWFRGDSIYHPAITHTEWRYRDRA